MFQSLRGKSTLLCIFTLNSRCTKCLSTLHKNPRKISPHATSFHAHLKSIISIQPNHVHFSPLQLSKHEYWYIKTAACATWIQVGDGPNFDKKVWNTEKPRLQKECGMHFPNLPFLIDTDGTAISQTHTIMRYLASSRPDHGLMGTSLKQSTQADLISEVIVCRSAPFSWIDRVKGRKRETVRRRTDRYWVGRSRDARK